MNIITQFFKKSLDPADFKHNVRQDLLKKEAQIGKHVFGRIPHGHSREFFRLDSHTWIWEETRRIEGKLVTTRTKYVIREREIVKSVNGASYERLSSDEARNFNAAVKTYVVRVKSELYNQV